jgi:plastocyanin
MWLVAYSLPEEVTPAMRSTLAVACATATAVAAFAGPAAAAPAKLTATVGPGFTITLSKKTVKAGTYLITVRDRSNIHNFHLTGPGLNKKTSVAAVKSYTWKVKLKRGTYKFVCDPHASIMKGTLKVT